MKSKCVKILGINSMSSLTCSAWIFILWVALTITVSTAKGTNTIVEGNPAGTSVEPQEQDPPDDLPTATIWNSGNMQLGIGILVFGFLGLCLIVLVIRKITLTEPTVRLIGLMYIITFVGFICVTSDYNPGKIAPVVGLFGTALGYLLGAGRERQPSTQPAQSATLVSSPAVDPAVSILASQLEAPANADQH